MQDNKEVKSLAQLYALLTQPTNPSAHRVGVLKRTAEIMTDAQTLKSDRQPGDFTDYRL